MKVIYYLVTFLLYFIILNMLGKIFSNKKVIEVWVLK